MLYTEFDEFLPEKYRRVDLYPENLRKEIDILTNGCITILIMEFSKF